jgi:excisionase family DNA binding protein
MVEVSDRWLSMAEICQHLGVGKDTVYKWINDATMPAHRMGRLWKFRKIEVDAWVVAGKAALTKMNSKKQGRPQRKAECSD